MSGLYRLPAMGDTAFRIVSTGADGSGEWVVVRAVGDDRDRLVEAAQLQPAGEHEPACTCGQLGCWAEAGEPETEIECPAEGDHSRWAAQPENAGYCPWCGQP